jgi:two-component system, NarL family, nitrate/nitrite response regulator NarL
MVGRREHRISTTRDDRDASDALSARQATTRRTAAAIAVELAIDDPQLAERVRAMIMRQSGLRLVDTEGPAAPDIRITDATAEDADAADVPVVVLAEEGRAWDALLGGAAAVLAGSSDDATLNAAIHAVAQGLTLLSDTFRRELFIDRAAADELAADADPEPVPVDLSARERQVLPLLAEGASNKVIARRLGITPNTAKFHVASIIAKLGAIGRTDAVARAMRLGLVMI